MERRCLGPTSEDLSMLFRLPFHLDDRFSVGCRQLAAAFADEFNQSIDIGRAPDSGSVDFDTVTSVEQLESIREKLIAWRLRAMLVCVRMAERRLEVLAELDGLIHGEMLAAKRELRRLTANGAEAEQCRPEVRGLEERVATLRALGRVLRTDGNLDPAVIGDWLDDVGSRFHAWALEFVGFI